MRKVALLIALASAGSAALGQVVVSNTYENLDGDRALTNVPVTFSRIGADGDFTAGITPSIDGEKLPAQVDVLRRAPDGSVRHALVSFVLPKLAAGGKVKIDWLNEIPPIAPEFEVAVFPAKLGIKLVLTTEDGKVLTSDLSEIIADDHSAPDRVKTLHGGAVMFEAEVHDVPADAEGSKDAELDVYWRIRQFTGEKSVRVACVVERTKERVKGKKRSPQYKFKSVKLLSGEKVLYEEGPFDHLDQTRYRIVAWTGGALENIHRRANYAYWVKGKFVPRYGWAKGPKSAKQVDAEYSKRMKMRTMPRRRQGILEPGIILRHMPNTGGRWDLGAYPYWAVSYLMTGAPKTYGYTLHADGNGAGAFFIHVSQGGVPGYNVFTVKIPPQSSGYRPPLYRLPDGSRTPAQPDHAHTPSLAYISYLLTGDKYYAEEMSFWASYQMGEWPHKGLRWHSMDRSFAWSLRMTTDAAFILPDKHPLKDYFVKGVNKCMDAMTAQLVNSGRRVHSPLTGNFQCSGRQDWVNAYRCSAWMYAWVVWSLGNTAEKGFDKAAPVRDWAAEYIVELYTSDDEYLAPDGKTYKIDPRDAIPYSTAIALVKTEIVDIQAQVRDERGRPVLGAAGKPLTKPGKGIRLVNRRKPKLEYIENYAAVWYWTKVNVDNGWYDPPGLTTLPDENGVWPLRAPGKGWGGGLMRSAYKGKVTPQANRHIRAMTGMSVAVDAGIPKAENAWKLLMKFGGHKGKYGIYILPRTKDVELE